MTTDSILDTILLREGGYVNHPADRGGPTKYGITVLALETARGAPQTADDVRALTMDDARVIYRDRYVTAPGFETLGFGAALLGQLIDHAVLSGPRTAIKDLQLILDVPADGIIGPVTRAAARGYPSQRLAIELVKQRVSRLVGIVHHDPTQLVFLRGWVARALSFL